MVPGDCHVRASIMGNRHRRNAVDCCFSGRGEGAADQQINSQICSRVDSRDDQIDLGSKRRQGCANAIDRCSINSEPIGFPLLELQWSVGRHAMPTFAATSVGRDNDDLDRFSKHLRHSCEQRIESRGINPIIIGQ